MSQSTSFLKIWLKEHAEESATYQGKYVAFLKGKGIVASGNTLAESYRDLKTKGYSAQDPKIEFGYVYPSPKIPLSSDPYTEWYNKNPDEIEKFNGKHIAVNPEKGVVASGATLKECLQNCKDQGVDTEKVTFDIARYGVGIVPGCLPINSSSD